MKVTAIVEMDLETHEYGITFRNRSHPGEEMDLERIERVLAKVLKAFNDGHREMKPQVLS